MSKLDITFGFVTNCLGQTTLDDAVEVARTIGFDCIEVGPSIVRDMGVFERVIKQGDIAIHSLIYARNFLTSDAQKQDEYRQELEKNLTMAIALGIPQITMSTGVIAGASLEDNLEAFLDFWRPYFARGSQAGVRFALEFCPTSGNFALAPLTWQALFNKTSAMPHFGLNYDPSHLLWQMIDPYMPITTFSQHIFSLHAKDTVIHHDVLAQHGILTPYRHVVMAPQGVLEARAPWWDFRIPGEGNIDWRRLLGALVEQNYQGAIIIELEDGAYLGDRERIVQGLTKSLDYLRGILASL